MGLKSLGQKSKNNFVQFLVQMRKTNFASEIDRPLEESRIPKIIFKI